MPLLMMMMRMITLMIATMIAMITSYSTTSSSSELPLAIWTAVISDRPYILRKAVMIELALTVTNTVIVVGCRV